MDRRVGQMQGHGSERAATRAAAGPANMSNLLNRSMNDPAEGRWIAVCMDTGCLSMSNAELRETLREELAKHDLTGKVEVRRTGCLGFCEQGPILIVHPEGTFYTRVRCEDIHDIVEEHILGGKPVERLLYHDSSGASRTAGAANWQEINFYRKQRRIVLHNCGIVDPENIDHYIARGGYRSLEQAMTDMSPEQVIEIVSKSGLRGRGGAGFPTGRKWATARQARSTQKYVICNADEGNPGAFVNRSLLEGDPHSVLEGLTIAGYAIGASRGFVYVRDEYPLAVERVRKAIQASREHHLLGTNLFSRDLDFDIEIRLGAGAYVCGEETALLQSIEGERGIPRLRPPFPAEKGLWDQPTTVNNVETLAWIPLIIRNGWQWFSAIGTEKSKGTKTFSLTGKIHNAGLVEVLMGTTLRELIFDIGGGIRDNRKFKAVLIGGPGGGCLPSEYLDTPIDFEALQAVGAAVGSGGIVVMDEQNCAVDIAHHFLSFAQSESCGKCSPCRVGTRRMLDILERIKNGQGKAGDVQLLENLANTIKVESLCGLGQTAPNPVLATLRYFRDEYQAHIVEHRCPAAVCQALVTCEEENRT